MRVFLYALMGALLITDALLYAWNQGFETGASYGYNKAITDGRMVIECKFKPPTCINI